IICSSRLPRKLSTVGSDSRPAMTGESVVAASTSSSLQLQAHHADEAVRHLLVAFELCCVSDQDAAMIDVDDRPLSQDDSGKFLIDRLARRRVACQAGFVEQLVGFRVRKSGVVLRSLGL